MRLRPGFAPDPTGGAYMASSQGPLRDRGGRGGKKGKGRGALPYFFFYNLTTAVWE